jgi:hypothetical protein
VPAKLVGDRKLGLIKYVMSLMNGARLGVAAQSVGLSEAAYREALKYAGERAQFGKEIINFPAVYEILVTMKARLQAARSLLYETSRFVDVYKAYNLINNDRKLTPEEREDHKEYQRLADIYTPILKLFASEYANQLAYDAIQVHGGSGFMKDYLVERLYRDARILNIYEGTSQLQVVAAIRGVTTGAYLNKIRQYEAGITAPEFAKFKEQLVDLTADYEQAVAIVTDTKNQEYLDFHARRLVEMAGHIIMSYLLLSDAQRNNEYAKVAEVFTKRSVAWNEERFNYIKSFKVEDLENFKSAL